VGAIVTCGTAGNFPSPKRAAAVRCDAVVPAGPARQAIMTFCSQQSGVPATT